MIDLAKEYKLHYIAQWIKHVEYDDMTEEPIHASKYWPANLRDVKDCDVVLAYATKDDYLGGALIEIGAALAYGKSVLLVGKNESFRCWSYHPLVQKFKNLPTAVKHINFLEHG